MRTTTLLMLFACAGNLTGYSQTSESDAQSKIVALENIWNLAAQRREINTLRDLLDDGFIYIDSNGKLFTKTDFLATVQASPPLDAVCQAIVVHIHGDTAIVTGILLTRGTDHGKPFNHRDRFIDTWRFKNGAWISIASLTTPIRS